MITADSVGITRADLIASALIHVMVVGIITGLILFQPATPPFQPAKVMVRLIAPPKPEQAKPPSPPKTEATPKPVEPPKPAEKAKPKPTAKPKTKPLPEDDFDPFAPITSKRNVSSPVKPAQTDISVAASANELEYYISAIQQAVEKQWNIPRLSYDSDPLVSLSLYPDGRISKVSILESSGNSALDASLIRAIEKAQPFEIPARLYAQLKDNKIRFHPFR